MAELVADCPRCGANKITFDLMQAIVVKIKYDWQRWYETFCVCRQCQRSTIFIVSESVDGDYKYVRGTGLLNIKEAVNRYVNIESFVSLKDTVKTKPPEHVPENVEAVFREGATCISLGCNNAAGAMFRLCIDLATKEMLPKEEVERLNRRTRRDLGLRLPWLFDNEYLPEALRNLSTCVREDGNDGAHAGTLSADDAADLLDFTCALLERIYTEPERLRIAQERRNKRRGKQ
ncbi:MAG: hypothetical protein IEMM0002_1249 [bacterium]|nr:MAG: hypothetical protein IEMM0002_1249 [bacterium]